MPSEEDGVFVVSAPWTTETLGNVATLQRGFDLPSRLRRRGTVPIVTSSGVEGTHCDAKVKGPGVVTGRYGTIGEVFFVARDFWPLNTTLYVRDFHRNDPLFVSYLLRTIDFHSHSGKTGVPGVNRNDLHEVVVLLPPTKAEQETIAQALNDADALIESLEELLAKKRQMKQGAMQELLTGKRRLTGFKGKRGCRQTEVGNVPQDWGLEFVESFAHITTGGRNTQDRVDDGLYPFFVRSQTVERINSYSFDGEAVLTAGDGVGTGKVFHYINGRFDAHQRVYRISNFAERVNGYFFYLYFSSHFYSRIMQMTAKSSVDSVRREMISRMLIPLPPTRAEQDGIATVFSDIDAEIGALELKLAKAHQLKTGMTQELLTGRIRLV
jgi:type I restriction enzyme S subunit